MSPGPETLVFDLYGTLVDPLGVADELRRTLSADDAARVAIAWRRKQLEYAFRMTVMNRYRDFRWVTERALEFALAECGCELSPADRAAAMAGYDTVRPFPDVVPGLELLRAQGHAITLLSNGSPSMIRGCLDNSGLRTWFPDWISVEDVGAFKPHASVYEHAARAVGRPIDRLRLVSCNPFDVVGAATAGMRTAWVHRSSEPFDTIGDPPDLTVGSLTELAQALGARST